jgi:hypothetical protein
MFRFYVMICGEPGAQIMDMIERVAEAIDTALEKEGGWDDGCSDTKLVARAALKAVRDMFAAAGNSSLDLAADEIDDALSSVDA